jgi:hypothetical protein
MTAEFASVQMGIETMVGFHLIRASPALGKAISKKHLRRLSDDERWGYLKALAKDAGYAGDQINKASDAFKRCKRVRDLVGHLPSGLQLMRRPGQVEFEYHYPIYDEVNYEGIPKPLTPQTFRQMGAECRWLHAFIDHIGFLAGQRFISPRAEIGEDGQIREVAMRVLEPPPLPVPPDWEPVDLWVDLAEP